MLQVSSASFTSYHVPASFDGARIVFISDVHAGPHFSRARVARLVDRVNALQPDIIILGGDYVGGKRGGAEAFYPEAARLRAPLGVYAVLGNHDSWEAAETARSGLQDADIALLENEMVLVEKDSTALFLAGLEDLQTGRPDISLIASGVVPTGLAILVSHNPDVFADQLPAHEGVFDIALAGHLHGGQVTFFGRSALWVPSAYGNRYRQGWREEADTQILVSRGVGTVDLPMRFFSPPEIHLITLNRGEPALDDGS